MERRDWSLKALADLRYIDNLEDELRAESLKEWVDSYLSKHKIEDFDLSPQDLNSLSELFYKNISFLKNHRKEMKEQIDNHKKIREFLK